jgi:thioredoxin
MMKRSLITIAVLMFAGGAFAQNTFEETIPYKEISGKMVITANVGGKEGSFLLDPNGLLCLTKEAADARNIETKESTTVHPRSGYEVLGSGIAQGFFVGKNVYAKGSQVIVVKTNEELKALGVDGTIGLGSFTNAVLTINSKGKTIITSGPYKPDFVKLANRGVGFKTKEGFVIEAELGGKLTEFLVDFKEDKGMLLNKNTSAAGGTGLLLANEKITTIKTGPGGKPGYPILGRQVLNQGVFSFDVSRGKYYFQPFGMGENNAATEKPDRVKIEPGKVNAVNSKYFREHIYDYKESKTWKLKGDKPVIIDFWASWCGPCIRMMPVMEELAAKYKDQVIFYKVNVDQEGELRQVFEAKAIPMMFFAPVNGEMIKTVGADSKEKAEALIVNQLLKK